MYINVHHIYIYYTCTHIYNMCVYPLYERNLPLEVGMTSQAQMAAIVPQAFQNKVPKVPKFMIHCVPLRVI